MEQISFFESDKIKLDDELYKELASIKFNESRTLSRLGVKVSRYEVSTKRNKAKAYVLETDDEHEIFYSLDDIYNRINRM